ncbi:MAG: 6-phosphofructokinase [Clostridia bacterium]|nr:6-phosphofructokinase [Clostridia bacterium]
MAVLYGNAIVGQSGGPTAAINATLSGVIRGAMEAKDIIGTLYGMRNGMEGLLAENFIDLTARMQTEEDFTSLEATPSAALGSCRLKLPSPEKERAIYEKVLSVFQKYNIRYFFYIGGNDSMDAVAKLSAFFQEKSYEVRIIGVPKTIDNDLAGTDHSPGFGSAAKYIATTMKEILCDCAVYTIPAVTIVEIMGRDAGWLATAAALPSLTGIGPDYIYLPERAFSIPAFLESLRRALALHPNVVVAISEGIRVEDGRYVSEGQQNGMLDAFGHKYLSGAGKTLEMLVKQELKCKVRSIELNLPQRCASHLSSETDIKESVLIGKAAVKHAIEGSYGKMMAFLRQKGEPYSVDIAPIPVEEVANAVRHVPDTYINKEGNGVTKECLDYLMPLIQGEAPCVYECGMPKHFVF